MDELTTILVQARSDLSTAKTPADVERVRTVWLGRHGRLNSLMAAVPNLPVDQRRRRGQVLNEAKNELAGLLHDRLRQVGQQPVAVKVDATLPGERPERGHLHPLTLYTRNMIAIWRSLGYDVHEGPELEDQWYNFEGLNMPPEHPARDIQDTFYIKGQANLVMRTHCSTVQLRSALHRQPPLKYVEIGRAYRHEATDAKHESMFSHCDGIVIDQHLTMAHLVSTLKTFFQRMFPDAAIRIRPSYFPFVEPGIEVDMKWVRDGRTEWLEMLGAGMVHPNVLKAMKLDPKKWNGFAFGMGVERQVMLKQGIPDIRSFFSGSLDFLKQF